MGEGTGCELSWSSGCHRAHVPSVVCLDRTLLAPVPSGQQVSQWLSESQGSARAGGGSAANATALQGKTRLACLFPLLFWGLPKGRNFILNALFPYPRCPLQHPAPRGSPLGLTNDHQTLKYMHRRVTRSKPYVRMLGTAPSQGRKTPRPIRAQISPHFFSTRLAPVLDAGRAGTDVAPPDWAKRA